ncbi:MAG: AmmeMemoRadiSam system radical SAM enzyme [Geothermobacteraceae bacterium]
MHEARFWKKEDGNAVRCELCRFHCRIAEGETGLCGVRNNRDGALYSLVYGRSIAEAIDPIEKKPFYHVEPGSLSYSIATVGCNFRCLHCQNHQISQWPRERGTIAGESLSPEQVVRQAVASGCRSIAYTYTEPTIYYEYAFDCARLAKQEGLRNLFVTNGYTETDPLEEVAPFLDAANVDLKAFREDVHRKLTGARLQGVLETLRTYRKLGIWIEVTTLVIPGMNDDEAQLRDIAGFIAGELGPGVPWHVTAFYPTWRLLDAPPTPPATLVRARRIGLEAGLQFVYTGNIADDEGSRTDCPRCGRALVERGRMRPARNLLTDGNCPGCGTAIPGLWGRTGQGGR